MSQPGPPAPPSPRTAQHRARLWLVLGGIAVLTFAYWLETMSRGAVTAMETQALAGDFPAIRREVAPASVDEFGRVAVRGLLREPPLSVASQRLTPPGKYVEILIANDGVPTHVKKTELVIGARDASGTWHPASAGEIAARTSPPPSPPQ